MNAALKLDASAADPGAEQSQARLLAHTAANARSSDTSWVDRTIEGRYRIDGVLGQATLGTVYLAHHVHTRKTLALKLLDPAMLVLGDAAARFEREAVATARVNHPNIVAASDYGRLPDGVLYLVLEHVKGPSLREVLAAGPLELGRALSIVEQIVQGLGAAHALGIIHRGVKPENVLLVQRSAGELVKLCDFGLAMLAVDDCQEEALTRLGTTPGTPEYMAPEQATGHWVDARSDLYAVGVLLYELLSGHVPFAAKDAVRVLGMHVQDAVPALPQAIPEAVARLVFDLLEKDPERRIQSASECAARLESIRGELFPVEASAPQAAEPPDDSAEFALPVQKSRAGWIAGICALTLLTGAVSMLIGQRTAEMPPLLGASVHDTATQAKAVRLASAVAPNPEAEAPAQAETRKKSARSKASSAKRAQPAKARTKTAPRGRDTRRQAAPARRTGPFGIYVPPPNKWF
jgi:serine/threonine protein kinase